MRSSTSNRSPGPRFYESLGWFSASRSGRVGQFRCGRRGHFPFLVGRRYVVGTSLFSGSGGCRRRQILFYRCSFSSGASRSPLYYSISAGVSGKRRVGASGGTCWFEDDVGAKAPRSEGSPLTSEGGSQDSADEGPWKCSASCSRSFGGSGGSGGWCSNGSIAGDVVWFSAKQGR